MLGRKQKRNRRHKRVRAKVSGKASRPRLCVFRSAKHIYAQLIDDEKGKVLISAKDSEVSSKDLKDLSRKVALANKVGELLAKKALEKKIKQVVFDRGGYKYHGRVKALAEGARSKGLIF